jgi:dolichyl-phosphate beta-glucosyltransferase
MPIEDVGKFIREIENGYDLAIASRFVPGLKVIKPVLWYRKISERVFRILRMIIINNYSVKDTQCGFKVFSQVAAKDIFSEALIDRFAFDAEIVYIAGRHGYKIKELPVTLQNPTTSSIRIFRDSANMLADLIRIRHNYFKGKYKKKRV